MVNTHPHHYPAMDFTIPEPKSSLTRIYPDTPLGIVVIWDPQPARLQIVSRLISACRARPWQLQERDPISSRTTSCCCRLAVVALGVATPSGSLDLKHIDRLKQAGYSIIVYEDGAQAWPLHIRCQVLLAGASWVLDSAQVGFVQALRQLLETRLQVEERRHDEEHRLKHVMRALGSVGESSAILTVFHTVLRISTLSNLPVLLTGETGTGKELLAHAIHQLDPHRCQGPFIALNCRAISLGLAESELFGYRRGAFTGADRDAKGLIRAAEGGVLFLDEVGELDMALQAKLLRVLQEHLVLSLGNNREVPVDVRIIAATNRNLDDMVQHQTFRADLWHRLHALAIHIPPLRERPSALKPLIEHFLETYRGEKPTHACAAAPEFLEALSRLPLPGNARELENPVWSALVNKDDEAPLCLRDLPVEIWQQLSTSGDGPQEPSRPEHTDPFMQPQDVNPSSPDLITAMTSLLDGYGWDLVRTLQACERLCLQAALSKANGNQTHAARLLGITSRSVYNKLHKYHIQQ